MAQYDVDIRDYWRILKRRKTIVILMVFFMGVFSYGFEKLREPVPLYEATTAVKIERMSNLSNLLIGMFAYSYRDTIATQAFTITSFPVLELAAKKMGWIPEGLSSEEIRSTKRYSSVIERLKGAVKTEQEPGTNIINILMTSKDPKEAAEVANNIAKAYRKYNILERNRQTLEMRVFIEKQLLLISRRLEKAEEILRAFKEAYNLVALDAQTTNVLNRLNTVESDYELVRRKREELASQLKFIEDGEVTPKTLTEVFFSQDSSSPIHGLSSTISDLSLKKEQLLFDFTEEHPKVIEINSQIAGVLNEIRKEMTSYQRTLKAQEASLLQTMNRLRRKNLSIPEKTLQLIRLEREVKLNETLYAELKTKHQETLIQESGKIEEVSILRPALVPTVPINASSKATATGTGIIIGIILGIVFALVSETLDTSIGTIEDVESFLQVPVLGAIPFVDIDSREKGESEKSYQDRKRSRYLVTHFDPKSIVAESYRSVRTNLQFMGAEKKGNSVLVTSSTLREGKTFSIVNLALSMAQAGDKVLLIEGDLRKPMVYKTFGIEKEPGLTDYILGNYEWKEVVNTITDFMLGEFEMEDILKTPGLDNLSILTAGATPPNPSEILNSPRFNDFINEAKKEYDMVLIDAPPVLPVADATEMSSKVDGIILVYQVGKIARGILKRAKLVLDNVNANVWGVILNNVKPSLSPDYYSYHYQYYHTDEESEERAEKQFAGGHGILQFSRSILQRSALPFVALILALALLSFGIYWKDLNITLSQKGLSLTPKSTGVPIKRVIIQKDSKKRHELNAEERLSSQEVIQGDSFKNKAPASRSDKELKKEYLKSKRSKREPPITSKSSSVLIEQTKVPEDASKGDGLKEYEKISAKGVTRGDSTLKGKSIYPYTIQVSSYRKRYRANRVVTKLKKKGDPVFTSLVKINGKGVWNRVYIGFYRTFEEARKAALKLKKRRFSYVNVVKMPYAIQVGLFDSPQEMRRHETDLWSKKYAAYSVPVNRDNGKKRLMIGAFKTEKEALTLSKRLKMAGFTPKVVFR